MSPRRPASTCPFQFRNTPLERNSFQGIVFGGDLFPISSDAFRCLLQAHLSILCSRRSPVIMRIHFEFLSNRCREHRCHFLLVFAGLVLTFASSESMADQPHASTLARRGVEPALQKIESTIAQEPFQAICPRLKGTSFRNGTKIPNSESSFTGVPTAFTRVPKSFSGLALNGIRGRCTSTRYVVATISFKIM